MTPNALRRRLCIPALAAVAVTALTFGGTPRTADAVACPIAAAGSCSGSQADSVTIAAGSLALSFGTPTVAFGTIAAGASSSATSAGLITETDTLGSATVWNVAVVATALGTINQTNLTINTATGNVTFPCSVVAPANCSATGTTASNLVNTAFSAATPQSVMTATAAAQGTFNETGVTYTLAVPWGTAAGSVQNGTLTYTITG